MYNHGRDQEFSNKDTQEAISERLVERSSRASAIVIIPNELPFLLRVDR